VSAKIFGAPWRASAIFAQRNQRKNLESNPAATTFRKQQKFGRRIVMSFLKAPCALLLALAFITPFASNVPRAHAQDTQATAPSTSSVASNTVAPVPYFSDPAISPDRAEIAFVSGGDIWTVPATGGEARLLVSHPATEARPVYSPDGKRLAFTSTRTGNGDIYVLTFDTGDVRRITFDDVFEILDGWSRDGRWLYFSSTSRDISGMNDIFRVSSDGGTPMQVSADRYTNEFFSSVAPDNTAIAFTARGTSSGQWWRKGHSHLDEAEIWVLRGVDANATPAAYERITEGGAKEMWPMWGADGRTIYYVSDRGGAQNVWKRAGASPEAGHELHERSRAVGKRFLRRAHDRLRARLPHLETRHGERARERSADRATRRTSRARDRSLATHGSDSRLRALA
jgi:dipeptidyl aminopeptidase/acylaminoacyl peptidase